MDFDLLKDFDGGCLNFTPEQKAERENFVRLLREDLGCCEGESIRQRIRRWKIALTAIADTPMKDDGLRLIQLARAALSKDWIIPSEPLTEAEQARGVEIAKKHGLLSSPAQRP